MTTAEVFALDIGTRTIAGLILASTSEGFELKEAIMHQQLPGAMSDGQIHHIDAVASTIGKIKSELEQSQGVTFNKVAVAAAGRSLRTQSGESSLELAVNQRLSADDVRALELDAVRDAVEQLSPKQAGDVIHSFLCVGYSVIQYYLDGEPIGSLEGHQGTNAKVQIIATFLPRIVIDSLDTALELAGLEMQSLTLEPIAAMHVVVPPTMRMLNIALVDVGAGTSDLAISAAGTVKGYGMVSYAGDAITAGLAEHFLLDFKVAEQLKVGLVPNQASQCQDVFGNPLVLSYDEVTAAMNPQIEILAEKIAQEIIELNGSAPKGVILIGGGSRVPGLDKLLAQNLGLPENLVRMRDRSTLQTVKGLPNFSGPEVITPIGIGCTHLDRRTMELIQVSVNGERLQFLNMPSSTVGEALLNFGIPPTKFVGRPGSAITVELNGRYIPLPGTLGKPALITKNGEPCELGAPLHDGDNLVVQPGQKGEPPQVTLGDFIDAEAQIYSIKFNGSPLEVKPVVLVNEEKQSFDYLLQDRDKIRLQPITNFKELFQQLEIPTEQEISFYLNEQRKAVTTSLELFIDGKKKPLNTPIRSGLEVSYSHTPVTLNSLIEEPQETPEISVKVNGQTIQVIRENKLPIVNGQEVSLDYVIKDQDQIFYQPYLAETLSPYIVTDIFRDYEPDDGFAQRGGTIYVNGTKAGFTTPIKHGDIVDLVPYGAETPNS